MLKSSYEGGRLSITATRSQPSGLGPLIRQVWGFVVLCLERQQQRRQLRDLGERALKDIGVSRADACREASKAFWQP